VAVTLAGWTSTTRGRAVVALAVIVVAYHYSLLTLIRSVGLDSPLAYLGLVPVMAAALGAMLGRPRTGEPDIVDRQVDVIIGVPLLVAAAAVVVWMPARMSVLFWYYRVDLLSLPLFAAGVVCLIFGVRTLWRVRTAVVFLVLAWPVPYTYALDHGLGWFSTGTLTTLHAIVRRVPLAVAQRGGDGSQFVLGHGAGAFTVSVASACTGVDGSFGFLLVGLGVLALAQGRRLAKLAWLLVGLAVVFALNLARLLLIFAVGSHFGRAVAIDGLHPVIGLLLFCGGTAAMVAVLGWFRLRLGPAPRPAPASVPVPPRPSPSAARPSPFAVRPSPSAARPPSQRVPPPVRHPRMRPTFAALGVLSVVLALANSGLGRYQLTGGDLGTPRLAAFADQPTQVRGWTLAPVASYDWTQRFFGASSSWIRYQYSPSAAGAPTSVLADVVTTPDLGAFNAYGVQACYRFHGFGLHGVSSYPLGGGVRGTLITFREPALPGDWNALYWVWPVRTSIGTRYERIVLLAPVAAPYQAQRTQAAALLTGTGLAASPRTELAASTAFLVGFGRRLVLAAPTFPTTPSGPSVSAGATRAP
jgi:exosortase/archaeosortase family protein